MKSLSNEPSRISSILYCLPLNSIRLDFETSRPVSYLIMKFVVFANVVP
nr:MAG TPA: hypothetical protein [Caudoviricetes sp.]